MVVSQFMQNAKEIEFDAVAHDGEIVEYAISEHVEFAGVHSGDATLVFPAQKIYFETARRIKRISRKIARSLRISGPFNIQYLARNNYVKVIECNLRASRSFPFVSKVLKRNFIDTATRIMLGAPYTRADRSEFDIDWIGGEGVAVLLRPPAERRPRAERRHVVHRRGGMPGRRLQRGAAHGHGGGGLCRAQKDRHGVLRRPEVEGRFARRMPDAAGARLRAVRHGGHEPLPGGERRGEPGGVVAGRGEAEQRDGPDGLAPLRAGHQHPEEPHAARATNGYRIRRGAIDHNIPLITNARLASAFIEAFCTLRQEDIRIKSWQEYE